MKKVSQNSIKVLQNSKAYKLNKLMVVHNNNNKLTLFPNKTYYNYNNKKLIINYLQVIKMIISIPHKTRCNLFKTNNKMY